MITHEETTKTNDQPKSVSKSSNENPVRIWIDIRISNGLHLSPKNLSYQNLVRMVEKLEGFMVSVNGLNHFYYVRDFTDMCCKHSRILSIIRERLHREPCDGDVLSEERKLRKSAERKVRSLQEKLDFANQERFGDRRQRINCKQSKIGYWLK